MYACPTRVTSLWAFRCGSAGEITLQKNKLLKSSPSHFCPRLRGRAHQRKPQTFHDAPSPSPLMWTEAGSCPGLASHWAVWVLAWLFIKMKQHKLSLRSSLLLMCLKHPLIFLVCLGVWNQTDSQVLSSTPAFWCKKNLLFRFTRKAPFNILSYSCFGLGKMKWTDLSWVTFFFPLLQIK